MDKIKAPHACQVEYGLLKHFVCVFIDSVLPLVTWQWWDHMLGASAEHNWYGIEISPTPFYL